MGDRGVVVDGEVRTVVEAELADGYTTSGRGEGEGRGDWMWVCEVSRDSNEEVAKSGGCRKKGERGRKRKIGGHRPSAPKFYAGSRLTSTWEAVTLNALFSFTTTSAPG